MSTDFDASRAALSERPTTAIAADIRAPTEGSAADDVLGIGVYTDADAASIVVAVQRSPQYRNSFLWSIGERDRLPFATMDDDALRSINDELAARAKSLSEPSSIEAMRAGVWEATVAALARVIDQGVLDSFPHAVRVFEPVDADVDEAAIRAWTARIGGPCRMTECDAWAANPSS